MHSLINQAGLIDALYRGNWKNGQRHGYGVQLFPNGAKYTGNWKKNSGEGFGRLDLLDGTFYEGNFANSLIQSGRLNYFNGTYFEGDFDGERDLFKSGRIVFRDNEVFKGSWSPDGIVLSGHLLLGDGKRLLLDSNNIVREETMNVSGKVIYWKKGVIYEGGLVGGNYDKKGFIYGNYRHPFYFESNISKSRFHGRYIYTSLYYGFCTEEYYSKGKEVGTWRYRTSKGYEYIGDTSTKRQIVRFPFLNNDHYEGELSIWCENITLVSGAYYMNNASPDSPQQDQNKMIRVINCDSITTQKDIVKRMHSFDVVCDIIEQMRHEYKRNNFCNENGLCYFDDGSVYKGHIINNYLNCHKNDFLRLTTGKRSMAPRKFEIKTLGNIYNNSYMPLVEDVNVNSLKLFKGTMIDGMKTGFCETITRSDTTYKGFYQENHKSGFGFYEVKDQFKFVGYFKNGKMNGDGTMITACKDTLKGVFVDGFLKGLGYIKYSSNNIEFFGQLLNNMKNGKGVLKFSNNYRFEGLFKNDNIDTSEERGRLVCKADETVEEGLYLPSQDFTIGFLRTVEGNDYIFDFKSGAVRKAL
jgi:hypothetical protein